MGRSDARRNTATWVAGLRLSAQLVCERSAFATADYSLTTDGIQVVNTKHDEQRPAGIVHYRPRSTSPKHAGPVPGARQRRNEQWS